METILDLERFVAFKPDLPDDFSKRLSHLKDWQSILTDLRFASEQASALYDIFEDASESDTGSVLQNSAIALFNSSVVLYSRATKTKSDHRVSFDFSSHFSAREKETHRLICRLRDEGVSHFGPGYAIAGITWNQDGVFAIWNQASGEMQMLMASRRKMAERSMVEALSLQTHAATLIAFRETFTRQSWILNKLTEFSQKGLIDPEDFLAASSSLEQFFGDPAAAGLVMQGERQGTRRGTAVQRVATD